MRPPSPWLSFIALAFLGCGSSPQPAPPPPTDAGAAVVADAAPLGDSGADAGVDRGPELDGPEDGAFNGGPHLDGGPPTGGGVCLQSSDCPPPLLCTGGRCRNACVESRDCSSGRCVNGPQGLYCLSEDEARCTVTSNCLAGLICAVDRRCRNECRASLDCPTNQTCVDQVCAQPDEVTGAHLPGWPGDGGAPDAMMLWGLSRGDHLYRITAVEVKVDGCHIDPASVQGMTLPATYDAATATLSIGHLQGTPAMPVLGSGQVAANMATLVRDNVQDSGTCSYHRRNVSTVTLFDHDKFTLDGVELESMFVGPACSDVPAGGACTSTWRWRMELAP
jgi:hypothetical protein